MGEVYNQAAKKVDAVTQVFANVVKWIKETKNEIIAFIRNAPELFGILFDYAQYYLNPANWISGDDEFEKKLAKRMQDALKKVSDTAKELSSQKEIKKTEESIQKVNEKQKDLNKTTKVGNDLNNEKNKNSKTALELVKEEAGLKAKILELEYQKTDYFVKQKQLDENRNATSEEELYLLNEQIRTIEKQKLAWLDTLKAKKLIKEITPKGEIVFQPKVKNADKVEIETLINNFNKELQNNQSKMQGLKLKINTDELELDKSIKELQKQKIEWEVSVGIKDEGALKIYTDEFQSELNLARNQIKQYEAGTLKISKENYANLLKKELEYSQKVLENQDRMYESKKKKIDSQYETELEKLKLKYSKEEEFLKIASDKILSNDTSKIENTKINALDDLKQKEDEKFKTLDRLRENDSISESNYEKRKLELQQKFNQEREKIESDSRKEKLQSEALLNGTSIELQRRKDEEILNLEKSKLKDEILLLEERAIIFDTLGQPIFETEKDKEAYNNLKSKLEDTEELLKSKADTISLVLTGLQETATESLMNLFTGDIDAIVDSWREYFNQLAGMLQAKASAFALDLILTPGTIQYLSALPFPLNVAAIPAITQAVNIAVKTISDPLIKPILSFPTGAKFESPTLAIVGDGAKLGMPNREWLFNDPQLIGIIQMASLSSNALIIKRLEMIDENLSKRNLTTKLKGKDIEISYNRTYQRTNARAR
jgi:hypothetical protein